MESEANNSDPKVDFSDVSRLAAGLVWRDRLFLAPLYLIILVPGLFDLWASQINPIYNFYLAIAERLLNLAFLLIVTNKVLSSLRIGSISAKFDPRSASLLVMFGLAIWAMVIVPVVSFFADIAVELKLFFIFLLIPGFTLSLRYFFYFFPIICGQRGLRAILSEAREIGAAIPLSAAKCLAAPIGIMSLLVSLVLIPSPDGKIAFWFILADSLRGIFWVLSSYLAISMCLLHLGESRWSELRLDPYRKARLTTLSVTAPGWLSACLEYKRGLLFLLMSAFVWSGNAVQLASSPPGPEIKLARLAVNQQNVIVELELSDAQHYFRGFLPRQFALAGNNRELVSAAPSRVLLDGESRDLRFGFPTDQTQRKITLEFKTERDAASLTQLEDLNLWYRHFKVMLLPMKQASPAP